MQNGQSQILNQEKATLLLSDVRSSIILISLKGQRITGLFLKFSISAYSIHREKRDIQITLFTADNLKSKIGEAAMFKTQLAVQDKTSAGVN